MMMRDRYICACYNLLFNLTGHLGPVEENEESTNDRASKMSKRI